MTPQTIIHKLLKKQKYAKNKEIKAFLAKFKVYLEEREIKSIIHRMRETGHHIGTDFKRGWFLVRTLKEHEATVSFWKQREGEARYMKQLAEKAFIRNTAKLLK